jgi:hypothetical protein
MTLTLTDIQRTTLSPVPVDGAGGPLPIPTGTTVSYVSDTPAVFAVTNNADGVTASGAGVSVGTAIVTGTMSIPNADTTQPPTVFTASLNVVVASSAIAGFTIAFTPPA